MIIMLIMMLNIMLIQKSDLPFFFLFAWKQFYLLCCIRTVVQNLSPFQKLSLYYNVGLGEH